MGAGPNGEWLENDEFQMILDHKRAAAKKVAKKQESACMHYDFTAYASFVGDDPRKFYERIGKHFKSLVFSLERGNKCGKLHFQGRGTLYERIRPESARRIELAQEMGLWFMQPTCKANIGNTNYQQKEYTHVDGPWSHKTPPALKTSDIEYIDSIRADGLPYLEELVEYLKAPPGAREILWIYDSIGNLKKSAVQSWLQYNQLAEWVPFVDNHKDLLQFCHGFVGKPAYTINIPRGIGTKDEKSRKDFMSFMSAIESLRDGKVYDLRNFPKKAEMNRPHVVIFSNMRPILDSASRDRWKIVSIDKDFKFVDVTEEILKSHDEYMQKRIQEWDEKETMRVLRHKRKWAKFVESDPEAAELIMEAMRKRQAHAAANKPFPKREEVQTVAEEVEPPPAPVQEANTLSTYFVFEED
jgi:hypothetical protein